MTHKVPANKIMQLQINTDRDSVESTSLLDAIDALRGALGDNPCVLLKDDENGEHFRHYFSDPDLEEAIKAVILHLPANNDLKLMNDTPIIKWEHLTVLGEDESKGLRRAKVFGGWIVDNKGPMVFVPDKYHEWDEDTLMPYQHK